MKKQSIAIIAIIVVGSLLSTVYAAGTIITDTGITTGNLTVTGTCTGCGGSSGSFTSYNTMFLNTTVNSNSGGGSIGQIIINTSGDLMFQTSRNMTAISHTGTILINDFDGFGNIQNQVSQTVDGKYQIISHFNSTASKDVVSIYKNSVFLQNLGMNLSQFSGTNLSTNSIAISPDGHYIAVVGLATGSANINRVLIFEGS